MNSNPLQEAYQLRMQWSRWVDLDDAVWPSRCWDDCCQMGVTRWVIDQTYDMIWDTRGDGDVMRGCLELARGHLLIAFILSQFQAACVRIAAAESNELKNRWLPDLAAGKKFATVGISHLTTSRQHTSPAVSAVSDGDGYRLTGEIPWVTGCRHADVFVLGGTLADGRQILAAVPANREGLTIGEPMPLLALTGSETGPLVLKDMLVRADELIAGPILSVIQHTSGGGAGSLTTSALALGHAFGSIDHLQRETVARPNLQPVLQSLLADAESLQNELLTAADEVEMKPRLSESMRTRSTDLALRSSQAFLTATKGAGFVAGHPAERLAREALFFLVWSCPQAVANHLLQNFSGCEA